VVVEQEQELIVQETQSLVMVVLVVLVEAAVVKQQEEQVQIVYRGVQLQQEAQEQLTPVVVEAAVEHLEMLLLQNSEDLVVVEDLV
jgi:hypothetical protein